MHSGVWVGVDRRARASLLPGHDHHLSLSQRHVNFSATALYLLVRFLYHYCIPTTLFCQAVEMSSCIGYTWNMTETTSLTARESAPASCPRLSQKGLHAIALVQEKWTLRILQVLMHGPAGFNEMSRNAGQVNSTTLAQRLVHLERMGLVRKTVQSTMPPRTSYELTEAGHALGPIIGSIAEWGERYLPDLPADCSAE